MFKGMEGVGEEIQVWGRDSTLPLLPQTQVAQGTIQAHSLFVWDSQGNNPKMNIKSNEQAKGPGSL